MIIEGSGAWSLAVPVIGSGFENTLTSNPGTLLMLMLICFVCAGGRCTAVEALRDPWMLAEDASALPGCAPPLDVVNKMIAEIEAVPTGFAAPKGSALNDSEWYVPTTMRCFGALVPLSVTSRGFGREDLRRLLP